MSGSVRLYIAGIFVCTIPVKSVEPTLLHLMSKGIKNVEVREQ
jgi:hypothetical protein